MKHMRMGVPGEWGTHARTTGHVSSVPEPNQVSVYNYKQYVVYYSSRWSISGMDGCAHKARSKKVDQMARDPKPTAGLLTDRGAREEGGRVHDA